MFTTLFTKLMMKLKPSSAGKTGNLLTSGELITHVTSGANLVDGKQTWQLTDRKDDIETMKKCCDAELKTMQLAGVAPSPFYFERVAILSRKQKNYQQEVQYCEMYIQAVDQFYSAPGCDGYADVRKGPRYHAILNRLIKAKDLLNQVHCKSKT